MRASIFISFAAMLSICVLLPACSTVSALKRAEKKAIRYLDSTELSYDHVILYVHLQEKYQLPELNFKKRLQDYEAQLKNNEDEYAKKLLKNLNLYRGLVDKNHKIDKSEIEQTVDLNYLVLSALYCKNYQVDSSKYFQSLKEKSAEGDYALTHSLLAIYFLTYNGCFEQTDLASYRNYFITENLAMISKNGYNWNDINIESVAIAQELGYKLPLKQLKQIIKLQQKDGGWKTESNEEKTSAHSTVLALWAILAFRNRLK